MNIKKILKKVLTSGLGYDRIIKLSKKESLEEVQRLISRGAEKSTWQNDSEEI